MIKTKLSKIFYILPTLLLISPIFIRFLINPVYSAIADHIVISEIKLGETGDSTDEFVELYNPTDSDIVINNFQLVKKTATSGEETILTASVSGTIKAHGYYLITHQASSIIDRDHTYSINSFSGNNVAILYDTDGTTIIDKVGMGTANDPETDTASSPANGKSIVRKALSTSTKESMIDDLADKFLGNGEDSDDNSQDFVIQDTPDPQNSNSQTEWYQSILTTFDINSSQETSTSSSTADGTGLAIIDTVLNKLQYLIGITSLEGTETAAHIHGFADFGADADIQHTLPLGEFKSGVWNYDQSDEQDILDGLAYVNIHTNVYPDGEIRGQITSDPQPSPTPDSSPTPTPQTTPSPDPSPSPDPTPTPQVTPTPDPSPTPQPTPTPVPSPEPSPIPSSTPSPNPSPSPQPSPTPQVTPSPAPSPSPTPDPDDNIIHRSPFVTCRIHFIEIKSRFFSYKFPIVRCTRTNYPTYSRHRS